MPAREGRRRLADVLRRERAAHGPHRNVDLVVASGLSKSTIDNVLHARPSGDLTENTLFGIDRGMGWTPGTAQRIVSTPNARVSYLSESDRQFAEYVELFKAGTPGQRRLALQTVRSIFRTDL